MPISSPINEFNNSNGISTMGLLIERDTGNWYASPHTLSNDEINEHFMKHCLMKAYLVPVKAVTNDAVFFYQCFLIGVSQR